VNASIKYIQSNKKDKWNSKSCETIIKPLERNRILMQTFMLWHTRWRTSRFLGKWRQTNQTTNTCFLPPMKTVNNIFKKQQQKSTKET